jgi:RNA polymerase sigma factor (sigma-70 family)
MSKKLNPTVVSSLLKAYYDSHLSRNEFDRIHSFFQPVINLIAKRRNFNHMNDLVAVGNAGLLNAINTFSPNADRNRFLGYALRSIKNSMIDYLRTNVYKHPQTEQLGEVAEPEGPAEQIAPQFTSTFSWTPEESGDYYQSRAAPIDYHVTTSHPVVVSYQIDKQNPARIGLTPMEVKMLDLDLHDYPIRKIAEIFSLSPKQIRTRLKKIKAKLQAAYR